MGKKYIFSIVILGLAVMFSGCTVRSYTVSKDRVDQTISGNRGYIQGTAPATEEVSAPKKPRETMVVEVELGSPFGRRMPAKPVAESRETTSEKGNLGYVEGTPQAVSELEEGVTEEGEVSEGVSKVTYVEYEVKKDDTLQKISKQFYGTYRKWNKIYQANKDKIKDPNRITPGKVLSIPQE